MASALGLRLGAVASERGGMTAFRAHLEEEIPRLRRYARTLARDRARAEDLLQNCLLKALANQDRWVPGTDLQAWLFTILHNLHISEVRRSLREQKRNQRLERLMTTSSIDATWVLDLVDADRAIAKLPKGQRSVLLTIGLTDLSYGEAAEALGLPIGTLRSRLGRARASLRQMTGRQSVTPPRPKRRRVSRSDPARPSRDDTERRRIKGNGLGQILGPDTNASSRTSSLVSRHSYGGSSGASVRVTDGRQPPVS
jgi:RNA polymerase sigma-70 factor, ECF subfamily